MPPPSPGSAYDLDVGSEPTAGWSTRSTTRKSTCPPRPQAASCFRDGIGVLRIVLVAGDPSAAVAHPRCEHDGGLAAPELDDVRLDALLEIGEHHGHRVRRQRPAGGTASAPVRRRSAACTCINPATLIVEVVVEPIDVFLRGDTEQEAFAHAIEHPDQTLPESFFSASSRTGTHRVRPHSPAVRS